MKPAATNPVQKFSTGELGGHVMEDLVVERAAVDFFGGELDRRRRGVQTVRIDLIVGSVGRYKDFDNAFLPTKNTLVDRWRKINRAFYDDVSLPPVTLYKVGSVYFVLDGNHRVSVAREHGVVYLDAEVFEASTRVPLTAADVVDADNLEVLGDYAQFLERTHLDQLRPDQHIRFTIGGAYERLIEHIAVHRYFMGLCPRVP